MPFQRFLSARNQADEVALTWQTGPLQTAPTNHYATLGLDRGCTPAQIRAAYRLLAKQQHPDLNPGSPAAVARIVIEGLRQHRESC